MANCKEEFLEHIEGDKVLICCRIVYEYNWEGDNKIFELPLHYTIKEYNKFLENLNFEYDNGYGTQMIFGHIWYADGSWSERYEYDGSECWSYKTTLEIPATLQPNSPF